MRFGSRDPRIVRLGYVTVMHWPRRPGKTPYKDKARTIVQHVKFQVRRKEGASVIMKWRKSDHYNSRFKSRRSEALTSEQQELRCKHPDQCKTSLKWHVFDSSKVWNPWLEDFQDDKFIFDTNLYAYSMYQLFRHRAAWKEWSRRGLIGPMRGAIPTQSHNP